MSSEILSQDDIDLLLGGAGPYRAGAPPRKRTREISLYDFRRPHRVSKERLRSLEAMYERLVKSLEGWIMGRTRGHIELSLQSVEQLSFTDFTLSLPTSCCSYLVAIRNTGGEQMVIDFGAEFAFYLVDRLLGGRGRSESLHRALTPIERMVVRTVADRITHEVEVIWEDYLAMEFEVTGFESVPEILRSMSGDAPVLVASVVVRADERESILSISLPFAVLDTFFADTGAHRRANITGSEEERLASRRVVEDSLRLTQLPIAARLPEFRISLESLTALREGSVLPTGLSRDSQIEVRVSGRTGFYARPARLGNRLAISITEVAEEGLPSSLERAAVGSAGDQSRREDS